MAMQIKPDEITSILKQRIEGLDAGGAELTEVGTVLSVADGIARIHGLENCMAFEMLELPHDVTGLALNLESDNVGAVLFGDWEKIVEGDTVKRTDQLLEIPVGEALLGRIVDPLGRPLDGKGDVETSEMRPAEFKAPGVVQRQPVKEPMQTGLKAIDSMLPVGRGPRGRGPGRARAPAGQGGGAGGPEGDRLDDPGRPRPARADHRRPPDRQDRDRDRHDHQQQGLGPGLRLRGDRPAHGDSGPARRDAHRGRRDGQHDHRRRAGRRGGADQVHGAVRGLCDGGVLPLQRTPRPLRLRRPHEARVRLPADVAAAAPPAGPRGVPRRRLLPAQSAARACGQAQRRSRGRLTDGAAGHRDAGRRRVGVHPDERHLDHRRADLPRGKPVLLGRAPGHQRRHLGVARGRQRADHPDAQGRRPPEARALAVPRPRGLRPVRLRPRPGHAAHARPWRAAGRDAEPGRALAADDRGPGRPRLRRHERLPRPDQDRARPRVPRPAPAALPLRARGRAVEGRRRRLERRDAGGRPQRDRRVRRRLRLRPRRGGPRARGPRRSDARGGGPALQRGRGLRRRGRGRGRGRRSRDRRPRRSLRRHGRRRVGLRRRDRGGGRGPRLVADGRIPARRQAAARLRQEHPQDHAGDGDGRRRAPAARRAADRRAGPERGSARRPPYAGGIRRMTRQAAEAAGSEVANLPILKQHENENRIAILLVTGDRGLAGAFNSQILRAGIRAANEYEGEGRNVVFYASGRRGVSSLGFRGREVAGGYTGFTDRPAYADAREIAEDLITAYVDDKIAPVEIFYNGYVSPLVQEVRRETLLPLQEATILEGDDDQGDEDGDDSGHHPLVEYEPGPEEILQRLVADYVEISVYRALLEATASEHGARMTAMRNASQNAGEVIDDLTLEMNRARQAEITQEIMEVVAGAEALV